MRFQVKDDAPKKGKCFIFGALPTAFLPEKPGADDYVIAADKGFERATEQGIVPDLLVGDFDSMGYEPDFSDTVRLNVRKDDTDVGHAIELALGMGYRDFVVYGAVGGKLDHTVANIQLASGAADFGAKLLFIGEEENFTVLKNSSLRLGSRESGRVSVFSLSEKSNSVSICGLSYEMENGELCRGFPLGVSNAFIGKEAMISVADGELLVIWENDRKTG